MAAVEGQLRHGGVAVVHEVGEFRGGEEAKFAGGLARVEEQAEVGGRDAGGFEEAVFLDIVGDEVVVARAAEFVEEAPDAQGVFAQEEVVFAVELLTWLAGRLVEPRVMSRSKPQRIRMGAAASSEMGWAMPTMTASSTATMGVRAR